MPARRRTPANSECMKIVVLDGYTLNPGDLSWDELRKLGPCDIHERSAPEQIAHRAADAEVVLTNKTELARRDIQNLSRLRYIGVLATGTDCVDLAAARERNVAGTNV